MKKFLAIDDNIDNLTTIKAVLKLYLPEYTLLTALSGAEGIKIAEQEQPILILLDIIMPVMDGFEVCKNLKADKKTSNIPIAMITAIRTDPESRIKGLELGVDAFLSKPIDPAELVAQVKVLIRIKAVEDKLLKQKGDIEKIVAIRTYELLKTNEQQIKSEEKYKSFLDNLGDIAYRTDLNGVVTYANNITVEATGLPLDAIINKSFLPLYTEESQDIASDAFLKVIKGEKVTTELTFKNGRIFQYNNEPLLDTKNQKICGIFGTARDITRRKLTEQQLISQQTMYKTLFDATSDAVLIMDLDKGLFVDCNKAALELFDIKRKDDLLKCSPASLSPSKQPNGIDSAVLSNSYNDKAIKEGSYHFEWVHKTINGREFPADILLTPFELNGKKCIQGTTRDITARKKAEEFFIQAEKMEAIGQLAGGIAHDSNNIITIVLGNVDTALTQVKNNYPENRSLIDKLNEIRECAMRASELNKHLLTLGQKGISNFRNININNILHNLQPTFTQNVPQSISLEIITNENLVDIKADEQQIIQLITNIVNNAVFAVDDSGTITVKSSTVFLEEKFAAEHKLSTDAPYVLLSISDTGCGMDKETLNRIFEPFYTTKPTGKGLGLGLSTVYGIVNILKGIIITDSTLDKGTKFNIYIPASISKNNNTKCVACDEVVVVPEDITILFVDDDAQILKMNSTFLRKAGFTLFGTTNISDAQLLASKNRKQIKLLITDVIMPNMNGAELYKIIQEFIPELNVIYTSGYTDDILDKYGVKNIKTVFLQKPYTPQNLQDCVIDTLKKIKIKEYISRSNPLNNAESVDIHLNHSLLIEHKETVIPLLDNAMNSLSKETIYPLAENLKNIDGLASFAVELMANIEHFDIDKIELHLEELRRCLIHEK